MPCCSRLCWCTEVARPPSFCPPLPLLSTAASRSLRAGRALAPTWQRRPADLARHSTVIFASRLVPGSARRRTAEGASGSRGRLAGARSGIYSLCNTRAPNPEHGDRIVPPFHCVEVARVERTAPRAPVAYVLSPGCSAGAAQDKDESTLARAYFRWSAEGWDATTKDGEDWPSSGELGYLKSSDDDDTLWYYTASPDFLGVFANVLP